MDERTCTHEGCERPPRARGFCAKHYKAGRAHGTLPLLHRTAEDRFWAKVEKTDACWLWRGSLSDLGYGRFRVIPMPAGAMPAHRFAYERIVGPIPAGLELDHLCRTPACVNPAHLEPVTHRENMWRWMVAEGVYGASTTCPQGHPYTPENTGRTREGYRKCRICDRRRSSHYYHTVVKQRRAG